MRPSRWPSVWTPRAQVSIAVTIHDINNNALRELGLAYTFSGFSVNENLAGRPILGASPAARSASPPRSPWNDQARVLASPNVSVLDGEEARVLIGDRRSFAPRELYEQQRTDLQPRGGRSRRPPPGPPAGGLRRHHHPRDRASRSSITGFLNVNGASYPQISTREAHHYPRVQRRDGRHRRPPAGRRDHELPKGAHPRRHSVPGRAVPSRRRSKVSSQVIISLTPIILEPGQKMGVVGPVDRGPARTTADHGSRTTGHGTRP